MPDLSRITAIGTEPGPVVTGPTTTIGPDSARVPPGPYQALVTDTYIRASGGSAGNPTTIILPTVANGLQNGQYITVTQFDLNGNAVQIQPSALDNIDGGGNYNLGNYGESITLQARISGGVANWLIASRYVHPTYCFPLQPTLAAGAQGPLSLGWLAIPQGPMFVFAVNCWHDAALTGGSSTFTINGLSGAHSFTITNPAQATLFVVSPGNNNWLTVPPTFFGAAIQMTITTAVGFAGPTTAFATILFW